MDDLNRQITELRGLGTEEAVEKAAGLERDQEKDLAKNASDDELQRRGFDANTLRKHYRRSGGGGGGNGGNGPELMGDLTREQLEARATELGVEDAADRDTFPTKAALVTAIRAKED